MGRCIMTGAAIGALVNLRPSPDGLLNGIDYGEWLGRTLEEVRANWARELAVWHDTPHLAAIPGGETLQAMLLPATAALRTHIERHADGDVVIVGHDSINRVILLHALALPLSHCWRFRQDPCAISELDFDDGAFTLRTLNETWHLRAIGAN
jgi:probable phosphoglycerate mutase